MAEWKSKADAPKDGTIILAMYSDMSGANPIRWGTYDKHPAVEGWFEADYKDEAFSDFEIWTEMPDVEKVKKSEIDDLKDRVSKLEELLNVPQTTEFKRDPMKSSQDNQEAHTEWLRDQKQENLK